MKKIISILLISVLTIGCLTGCGLKEKIKEKATEVVKTKITETIQSPEMQEKITELSSNLDLPEEDLTKSIETLSTLINTLENSEGINLQNMKPEDVELLIQLLNTQQLNSTNSTNTSNTNIDKENLQTLLNLLGQVQGQTNTTQTETKETTETQLTEENLEALVSLFNLKSRKVYHLEK